MTTTTNGLWAEVWDADYVHGEHDEIEVGGYRRVRASGPLYDAAQAGLAALPDLDAAIAEIVAAHLAGA